MLEIGIWIDVPDPDGSPERVSQQLATARMSIDPDNPGLSALAAPLSCRLPSGLKVTVNCECVPGGDIHLGIEHDAELLVSSRYRGGMAMRMFPVGHDSYVVSVTDAGPSVAG